MHFVPNFFAFYLASDPFFQTFNGDMKLFRVDFGKGSFRSEKYEEIMAIGESENEEIFDGERIKPERKPKKYVKVP